MSRRRSEPKRPHLHEAIALYLTMQKTETAEGFQQLLAEHDACTDADGQPRLALRTLVEFGSGPPSVLGGDGRCTFLCRPRGVGKLAGVPH